MPAPNPNNEQMAPQLAALTISATSSSAALAAAINAASPTATATTASASTNDLSSDISGLDRPSNATGSASNLCHTCKGSIATSQFIRVGMYKFHKEHFVCVVCSTNLHNTKFHHKDSQFYCSKDYIDNFCHTCKSCTQKITSGSIVQAFGNHYHPEHFVCVTCQAPFKNGKYYEYEKEPYCEEHYFAIAGDKCEHCGKPVRDNDVIRVHNKVYHTGCLTCSHCSTPLGQKGNIFQKDGKIYCKADYLNLFCKRCTACGEHIIKHCISVNDEYYHPDCLICSVCGKRLQSYICVSGHLRCADHTEVECPKCICDVCSKPIDDEIILTVGKRVHPNCFTCAFCHQTLEKSTAKLRDNLLCCPSCITIASAQSQASPKSSTASTVTSSSTRRISVSTDNDDSKTSYDSDRDARTPDSAQNNKNTPGYRPIPSRAALVTHAPLPGPIEWQKGEMIGKGSFGKVYMAMNRKTGALIAVKQVRLNTSEEKEQATAIQNEIALMENLRHPNIVSLLGTQRIGGKLNILMEYVPGKSLDSLLQRFGPFSEVVIRSYTKQLLDALAYCHANRVVHRDIKGKNILIDTVGNLKLADFGSAKRFTNVMSKDAPSLSYNYTPLWTAPEVLVGDYNSKVDVWSLGCVIIEMASGEPPWSEQKFENPFRALYHIGNSDAIPKIPEHLSPISKDFVRRCLTRNPDRRPTAEEMLQHPWLQGIEPPAAAAVPRAELEEQNHQNFSTPDTNNNAGGRPDSESDDSDVGS